MRSKIDRIGSYVRSIASARTVSGWSVIHGRLAKGRFIYVGDREHWVGQGVVLDTETFKLFFAMGLTFYD